MITIKLERQRKHRQHAEQAPRPFEMHSLFVGDFPQQCGELELSRLFGRFGAIVDIRLKRTASTQRQPYATISFATLPAAETARLKLDGFAFMGRKLR